MFLNPDLALRRGLELPDRGDLLELVDAPLAGPECLGPVLGGSDDQHDVLANLDVPVAVDDQDFDHVEVLQGPLPDLAELLLGHPFVILELDAGNVVALGPVPGGAQENRDPPMRFERARTRASSASIEKSSRWIRTSMPSGPAGAPPANGGSNATSSSSPTTVSRWAISWLTETRTFFL